MSTPPEGIETMTIQATITRRTSPSIHAYSVPVVRELPASPGLILSSANTW